MIGRLTGILLERNPPQILLDVQGVGYEIDVPMSTFYNLPVLHEKVVLYTQLIVREDAHLLYLLLVCVAVADHGLFDLQGGVFGHRQISQHCRANRRAARLAQQQRGLRIDVDEHFFHRDLLRLMLCDHFAQGIQNCF